MGYRKICSFVDVCGTEKDYDLKNEALASKIYELTPKNSLKKPDFRPVLGSQWFIKIVKHMAAPFRGKVDYVLAPATAGWPWAAAIAAKLNVPMVTVDKTGSLPYDQKELLSFHGIKYVDYSGKEKMLEVSSSAMVPNSRVLIVDDWTDTGGAIKACKELVKMFNGTTVAAITLRSLFSEAQANALMSHFKENRNPQHEVN